VGLPRADSAAETGARSKPPTSAPSSAQSWGRLPTIEYLQNYNNIFKASTPTRTLVTHPAFVSQSKESDLPGEKEKSDT
jgi:hypothetical protein